MFLLQCNRKGNLNPLNNFPYSGLGSYKEKADSPAERAIKLGQNRIREFSCTLFLKPSTFSTKTFSLEYSTLKLMKFYFSIVNCWISINQGTDLTVLNKIACALVSICAEARNFIRISHEPSFKITKALNVFFFQKKRKKTLKIPYHTGKIVKKIVCVRTCEA